MLLANVLEAKRLAFLSARGLLVYQREVRHPRADVQKSHVMLLNQSVSAIARDHRMKVKIGFMHGANVSGVDIAVEIDRGRAQRL